MYFLPLFPQKKAKAPYALACFAETLYTPYILWLRRGMDSVCTGDGIFEERNVGRRERIRDKGCGKQGNRYDGYECIPRFICIYGGQEAGLW
jgi:hypothetical protein